MERKCFSEILSWNRKKDRTKPLKNYEHDLALDLLHEFLCIGGLPEVVDSFLKNHSYVEPKEILNELYESYIVDINGDICPIDVKKNKGCLNSLKDFRENNKRTTAIKISSNQLGYNEENDILTVPLYMTFLLADDIVLGKIKK